MLRIIENLSLFGKLQRSVTNKEIVYYYDAQQLENAANLAKWVHY